MSAVLVLGAGNLPGRAIVDAALDVGQPVLAVADDADALDALRARHPRQPLETLHAVIASDGDAARLARRIRTGGHRLGGVVAAIGGEGACGRLLDQPAEVLRRALDQDLLPHLVAARHLYPLLARTPGRGHVLVGGAGATYPWAGYGHRSIAAAALRMLARVLHEEARRDGVRVHLLSAGADLHMPDRCPPGLEPSPQVRAIARRALALLEAAPSEPCVVEWRPMSLTSTKVEAAASAAAMDHLLPKPMPPDAHVLVERLLSSPSLRNPTP